MEAINDKMHSSLGPSIAHRWLSCPASVKLEAQFPDRAGESAAEGTLAHALCELKLKHYFFTKELTKRKYTAEVKKLKQDPLWNDEMEGYTDVYLDYIRELALSMPAAPYVAIEKHLDMSKYIPGCFGTGDCILIQGETLHVIDFKYGKSPNGRVQAEENPQMLLYALGAYSAYSLLYRIKKVVLHIVQPRLPDGITSWETSVDYLMEFAGTAAEQAEIAMSDNPYFSPSEKACRYCKAGAVCKVRAEENAKLQREIKKDPELLSPSEIGAYLEIGEDIHQWLETLKAYALTQCLNGREIPGWKAVEGRGSRDWTDADEAFRKLTEGGIKEEMLYERKPLTLAQTEKTVGKKIFDELVGDLVTKKPGKPALVPESDKRPAITNKPSAAEVFGN